MISQLHKHAILLSVALLTASGGANAAGFDCRYAKSPVEKLICANPNLSKLDSLLKDIFVRIQAETRGVDGETGDVRDPIAKDQTRWRETVRDVCPDAACLESAYGERIRKLRKDWPEVLQ